MDMRRTTNLNKGWLFTKPGTNPVSVDLPHTWNVQDGADGGDDYWRGICTYERRLEVPAFDRDREEVWLQFDGVNSVADVYVNGKKAAHHEGGYSTFRCNITGLLPDADRKSGHRDVENAERSSREAVLTVKADNGRSDSVYPQKADFTFYGGIYRDVSLLIVSKKHFLLNHLGGNGLFVTPRVEEDQIHETAAGLTAENVSVQVESEIAGDGIVQVTILDAHGNVAAQGSGENITLTLESAHLWNGIRDPYLYTACARLLDPSTKEVLDEVQTRFGIRCIRIDARKGFCLNGRNYPLHGVSRHQDRRGYGNALTREMHEEDVRLILECGANTVRLAHYQHAQYFYDLCDEAGLVVWAEIPYISEHLPFGKNNTISQLRELIAQNYNHASICVWGISNEITISTKDRKGMLENHRLLQKICHEMDKTRPTVLACYAMCTPWNPVAHITDAVSWNLYLGWYVPGMFLNDLWISFFHFLYPKRALGFSEYGAEGMPDIHSAHPRRGDQSEEYQAKYHEFMLRCFQRHPWMWATHVWNMFDFAADARDQGGEPGMNHKGLITFDRKTKKDSFYLYKAYWNKDEPFVHICSGRFRVRTGKTMTVKVYTNQERVTLYAGGAECGTKNADKVVTFRLSLGEVGSRTDIRVEAGPVQEAPLPGTTVSDEAVFVRAAKPDPAYKVKKSGKKNNWV